MRSNHHLRFMAEQGLIPTDPFSLAEDLADSAWTMHAAGEESKGIRLYD